MADGFQPGGSPLAHDTPALNRISEAELKGYLAAAKSFDDDRVERIVASERRAWRVVSVLGVCLAAVSLGLALAMPLHTVAPPHIVEVDRSTGEVNVATSLNGMRFASPTEVDHKYWLWNYVFHRESYAWQDVAANAERVSLMSDAVEQGRYAKSVDADNPKSPQRLFGKRAAVVVTVRSISLGKDGASASVRFSRTLRDLTGSNNDETKNFIATVTYSFVETTMPERERLVNPRGFTVSLYRLDEELK